MPKNGLMGRFGVPETRPAANAAPTWPVPRPPCLSAPTPTGTPSPPPVADGPRKKVAPRLGGKRNKCIYEGVTPTESWSLPTKEAGHGIR
jgi:hypothetical protein